MILDGYREQLQKHLLTSEAIRLKPYWDCCGRGLRDKCITGSMTHRGKLTIGIGRNIEDVGISNLEAYDMNLHDIDRSIVETTLLYPWIEQQEPARQAAMVELMFNMGARGLGTFVNTLAAWKRQDYPAVAAGLRASKWRRDVGPTRSGRIINWVLTGEW